MDLSLLGSAGIGVVWGWILGTWDNRIHTSEKTGPAIGVATVLVFLDVYILEGIVAILVLLGAIIVSRVLYGAWQHYIRWQSVVTNGNSQRG
jgi:hypothetical protein